MHINIHVENHMNMNMRLPSINCYVVERVFGNIIDNTDTWIGNKKDRLREIKEDLK